MLVILKWIQSIFGALNSEGTPRQVGAGIALGAALGLTPLLNIHNLCIYLAAYLLNVSLAGFSLGWALFIPVGFLLDPLFDRVGEALLAAPALQGFWTGLYNQPGVPLTNFNNTIVLGSVVTWLVALVPIALAAEVLVARYRATLLTRLEQTPFFKALKASQLYNYYRWFRPE